MKTGILTFHDAVNYGASLQAYALLKFIRDEIGIDAEIINYQSKHLSRYMILEGLSNVKSFKRIYYKLFTVPYLRKRIQNFEEFDNRFLKISSEKYNENTIKEANEKYDAFVVGSDQVFNLDLIKADDTFFLDFATKEKRKVAYAASLGNYEVKDLVRLKNDLLRDFNGLSFREISSAETYNSISEKKATCMIDPTLLLDSSQWTVVEKWINTPKEYIFLYLVSPNKDYIRYAKKVSRQLHLPIVYIPYSVFDCHLSLKNMRYVSPSQFLFLIHNAKYVLTNSFHGTVFAINYKKNYSVLCKQKNSRVENVLKTLNISSGIQYIDHDFIENDMNFYDVNIILDNKRACTKMFFKEKLLEERENRING